MSEPRKFFRTILTFEVLSEDRPVPEDWDLLDIQYEISEGGMVGSQPQRSIGELDAKQASAELKRLGSYPGFFNLDDDGTDLREGS